jgi:hypothetical protein
VTVTWTATSTCEANVVQSSTFTVTAAPAVAITCATDLTVGSCLTQTAVNTAYANWIASTTFTGGCNAVLTNNSTGAPLACGGSKTVIWTITSGCEVPVTCTKTFTVPNAPAVVLTAPVAATEAACQTQAAIDAKFATWLGTATYSGGCTLSVTNNAVSAPAACGGTVTVTWTATSTCEANVVKSSTFTVTAAPAVSFTCAIDKTEPTGQTQAMIDASFAAWLLTTTANGGCGGILSTSPASPVAPPFGGGFTTVTWNYTTSCDVTSTCTKTFTVENAPTVVFTCGTNVTVPACQTQAQVDAAYAAFLASTTASGGCNGVLTNNAPVNAPNICGGTVNVTWTYTSTCAPLTTTCTRSFTVTAAPAVVFTCGTDITVPACQTQAQVDAAYAAFIASTTASGGCNGVLTNNAPATAPSICGGSVAVIWTYNTSCGPTSCTKTFTVTPAPAVVFNCASDLTVAACQAQSAIDAAFATWLTTVSVSGGCNPIFTRTPANPVAPLACGGFTDVTWTYTSSCDVTKTCTRRFTVTDPGAIALTCPPDYIQPTGQTQAVVDANYATWLASVSASGGCSVSLTNNGTGAPSASGGSVIVTWTGTSSCAPLSTTCSATFAVAPTYTISGTLKYHNLEETPMSNVQIRVQKSTTPSVDRTYTTPIDGSYIFANLPEGIYTLTPNITKPVDDINSTDAAQVNSWGTTTGTIEYVKFLAGDVADNLWLNGTDALKIQRHFVNGDLFDKGPWSCWPAGFTVNSNWDPASKPLEFHVTISGANVVNYGLYAMVNGDFNGGFTPGTSKSANASIGLVSQQTRKAGAGEAVELPLTLKHASTVGAVSLILDFPMDLMEVTGVTMNNSTGDLSWAAKNGELRIGWYSPAPSSFEANSDLLVIQLKTSETFGPGDAIRIKLAASSLNELADGNFAVIPDALLGVDVLEFSTNGTVEPLNASSIALVSHPNPFKDQTTLSYTLPAEGHVTLKINSMLGQTLLTVVDKNELCGMHIVNLDGFSLQPGIYIATITFRNNSGGIVKTIKLVRNR